MTPSDQPTRERYPHRSPIQTRWADNDAYGHVNNVVYYAYFDALINAWLIAEGGLDVALGSFIGVCAESGCQYVTAAAYPEALEGGLRVAHLGRSSVRYEVGIFRGETVSRAPALNRPLLSAARARTSRRCLQSS